MGKIDKRESLFAAFDLKQSGGSTPTGSEAKVAKRDPISIIYSLSVQTTASADDLAGDIGA